MTAQQLSLFPEVVKAKKKKKIWRKEDYYNKHMVLRVLLCGGGKQSSVLALMAKMGHIDIDVILYADTGLESRLTDDYIYSLSNHFWDSGIEFHITTANEAVRWAKMNDGFIDKASVRASMPFWTSGRSTLDLDDVYGQTMQYKPMTAKKAGALRRQCTNELKIQVGNRYLRKYLLGMGYAKMSSDGKIRIDKDVYIETLYGISLDEALRADTKSNSRNNSWQFARYPLLEMGMDRSDCEDWLKYYDLTVPPKSACICCPYRNNESWQWMKTNKTEDFTMAVEIERQLNRRSWRVGTSLERIRSDVFLHPSCRALDTIDFMNVEQGTPGQDRLFEYELVDNCFADGGFSCGL